MPWDSTAQRESAELGGEAADTRAALGAAYNRDQHELGFGIGADNPYSRLAENRERLASNQRRIVNTAGNQLYAGSTINRQSGARTDYDRAQKAIEADIAGAQADYNGGMASTARDEQLGGLAIREGAVSRAAATEPDPLGPGGGRRRRQGARGRQGGRARANRGRGRI